MIEDLRVVLRSERAEVAFKNMARRIKDLKPIWQDFLEYYKGTVIPNVWSNDGNWMGNRWAGYKNPVKYLKWKKRYFPQTRGKKLVLTGTLFEAAKGDTSKGWFEIVKKQNLVFGIRGIAYAARQHWGGGGVIARYYLMTRQKSLPSRAWHFLTAIAYDYLMGDINEQTV